MDISGYISKTVKILDALATDNADEADSDGKFIQTLNLLLRDVDTNVVFTARLEEPDVRKIIRFNEPLTTKQMIDLATALRQREDPLKLLVPESSLELSVDDVIKSRNLDGPKNAKRKRYRHKNKNKKFANTQNSNVK
jgi:hypothetical protein